MTYEQIVENVRAAYEDAADARDIFEHVAVQVNVEGEGHGAFYVEIANRQVCVEPYEYYDRDGVLTTTADTIMKILSEELSFEEAYEQGLVKVQGNMNKLHLLEKIRFTKQKKRKAKKAQPKDAQVAEVQSKEEKSKKE